VTILVLALHAQGHFFLAEGPAIGPVEGFPDEGIGACGLGPCPVLPLLVAEIRLEVEVGRVDEGSAPEFLGGDGGEPVVQQVFQFSPMPMQQVHRPVEVLHLPAGAFRHGGEVRSPMVGCGKFALGVNQPVPDHAEDEPLEIDVQRVSSCEVDQGLPDAQVIPYRYPEPCGLPRPP